MMLDSSLCFLRMKSTYISFLPHHHLPQYLGQDADVGTEKGQAFQPDEHEGVASLKSICKTIKYPQILCHLELQQVCW